MSGAVELANFIKKKSDIAISFIGSHVQALPKETLVKEKGKVKKIPCVANSLVTFPNDYLHTGTTQTDEPFRYILNLNYYA